MNGVTASLNVIGSPAIDLDGNSSVSIDGPLTYDARSGGPQRRTVVFGPGGVGRFRYLDTQLQTIVVPGDANAAKASIPAPEITSITALNPSPIVVTTSDGQTTNVTVDSASIMTVTGPSRDGSGSLNYKQRLETKIKPYGRAFSLTVAS